MVLCELLKANNRFNELNMRGLRIDLCKVNIRIHA